MTDSNRPVGVFDSGVGGLTVVRAIRERLPGESIVYFGDTARVPYGAKSPETVIRFALENTSFLMKKNIKLLVVACNTASAVSLQALRDAVDIPVTGVIQPGARTASEVTANAVIGVIGTLGTISSGAYQKELKEARPDLHVIAQPCPLLVPLVEEGWLEHKITKQVISEYMEPLLAEDIDTLVLGCTHYPLLIPALKEVLGSRITLVDSAQSTAVAVEKILCVKEIISESEEGKLKFFVSDIPIKFQEIAQRFLGTAVPLVTQVQVGN